MVFSLTKLFLFLIVFIFSSEWRSFDNICWRVSLVSQSKVYYLLQTNDDYNLSNNNMNTVCFGLFYAYGSFSVFSSFFIKKNCTCSHEEIDVSHPEFFSTAKLNGYIPPNKEVGSRWCSLSGLAYSCFA